MKKLLSIICLLTVSLLFLLLKISDALEPLELPDLIIVSVSNPPENIRPGKKFAITDTTMNQGVTKAYGSVTRYYLSLDTVKDDNDILLMGSRKVKALKPGKSSSGKTKVSVPDSTYPGSYYLIACADDNKVIAESNETNNCSASQTNIFISGSNIKWFESWLTAPLGEKEDVVPFIADSGEWWPLRVQSGSCNYNTILPGDRLQLYAQAAGSPFNCNWAVSSSDVWQQPQASRGAIPMTKNTMFRGNWSFEPDINTGGLNYDIEGIIEIYIPAIDFKIIYSHIKSVSGRPDSGYCSPGIPFLSRNCINLSDSFERNIYNDFVTLYGDEFTQWYNDSNIIFNFLTIEIHNWATIEDCAVKGFDPPYGPSCDFYVNAVLTVNDLMLWEKN